MYRFSLLVLALLLVSGPLVVSAQGPTTTFSTFDDAFTFEHPVDWLAVEIQYGIVMLGNSRTMLMQRPATPEDVQVVFYGPSIVDDVLAQFGLDTRYGANITGNMMTTALQADMSFDGGMEVIDLSDGRQAFSYAGTSVEGNAIQMIAIDVAPGLVVVMIVYGVDLTAYQETLIGIADSVRYTPPVLAPTDVAVVWHQQAPLADWGDLGRMAVGPDDELYVSNGAGFLVFDPADGGLLKTVVVEGAVGLVDIAVASDGTLWAVDSGAGAILHLTSDGALLGTWTSTLDRLFTPVQISLDPTTDTLYILDETTSMIERWDAAALAGEAQPLRFEAVPADRGFVQVGEPSMAFDPQLGLAVTDSLGDVWVLDAAGVYQGTLGWLVRASNSTAFAARDGYVLVASINGMVYRFTVDAEPSGRFGDYGAQTGAFAPLTFARVRGLGVLSGGDVVVLDANDDTAQLIRVQWQR